MKKRFINRWSALILIIALIVSASGCGFLGGGVEEDIIETVEAFFDDVRSGRYAEDGFVSDYAIDDPFNSIDIDDERVQLFVAEGLTRIRYDIEEVQGSRSDRIGECVVFLEVVDIELVFENVLAYGYDEDAIIEAMGERRVETVEIEVILDLEYDADNRAWVIYDSSEFAEAFTAPYLDLDFPMSQTPEEAFEHFVSAIQDADSDVLAHIFGLDWVYEMLDEDELLQDFITSFLRNIDFYIDDLYSDDEYADFYLTVFFPDPDIINQVLADVALFESIIGEIILGYYHGEDVSEEYIMQIYLEEIIDRFNRVDVPKIEVNDVYLSMYYDTEEDAWKGDDFEEFSSHVEDVFDIDFDNHFEDDAFDMLFFNVATELLNEGLISEDFFDEMTIGLDVDNGDPYDVTAQMLYEDIYDYYWVDPESGERVESYDASTAYVIEHAVSFSSNWDDVDIYVVWYYENGQDLEVVFELEHTLESEYTDFSFWVGYTDYSELLMPGTYYISWETMDGEIIIADMVDVG